MPKATILIVEDESITALFLQNILEDNDYYIMDIISSGEEAVRKALKEIPDLILMDIQLNGVLDGIETVNKIRKTVNIPIIYTTASSDEQSRKRAQESGIYEYLIKPIKKENLLSAIEKTLSHGT